MYILFTATMFRLISTQQLKQTIYSLTALLCIKIIFMQHSSTRKKAGKQEKEF